MKIAVDLRYSRASGAASYINSIVPLLLARPRGFEFTIIDFPERIQRWDGQAELMPLPRHAAWRQAIEDQVVLPRQLRRRGIEVYHPMKLLGTLHPSVRQVSVAHSITEPYKGEFPISRSEELYWIHLGKWLFRHSERVIAVSEFVRDFAIEALGIAPERITVIPHGIGPVFLGGQPEEQAEDPYLLIVGNVFPVKNQLTAVKMLGRITHRYPRLRLVMAGATDHNYCAEVRSQVSAEGLDGRVEFLGFVAPDRLAQLYLRSTLLLMPSLTEGCPVTLLEAMGCGVAAVGSRRGGIPEIGGEAISLVDDPYDVDAWQQAVVALLDDAQARAAAKRLSQERAKEFSWERAAERTLAVYDTMR